MKTGVVWKYELWPQGSFTLTLPAGWTFRHLDTQRLSIRPQMWVEVDPNAGTYDVKFKMVLTGEKFDPATHRYLGTVLLHGGDFVSHLYQVIE